MGKGIFISLFFIGFGIWTIIDGIRLRRGTYKSWFYVHRTPTIVMPNIVFGSVPAGFGMLCWGFALLGRYYSWFSEKIGLVMLAGLGFPLFGLGVIFWLWKPRFMQPDWYQWLDEHYGRIMSVLKKDAERLGKAWEDRVRTQEGLRQWAEEVRQRVEAERRSKRPSYRNKAS